MFNIEWKIFKFTQESFVFDDAEGTEDAESKDDEKDEKSAALDPDDSASTNQGKAMFDLDNENVETQNFC